MNVFHLCDGTDIFFSVKDEMYYSTWLHLVE